MKKNPPFGSQKINTCALIRSIIEQLYSAQEHLYANNTLDVFQDIFKELEQLEVILCNNGDIKHNTITSEVFSRVSTGFILEMIKKIIETF